MDLEQQRKRAKDLRRAHAAGDPSAIERVAAQAIRRRDRFTLADAQLVIAREAGFPSWPAMVHVLDGDPSELLVRAVQNGKPDVLIAALGTEPPWWQVIWALRSAVELDVPVEMIRALVAVAVRPSVREPALVDAIRLHRHVSIIEALLDHGSPALLAATMRAASRYDHVAVLSLLARRGVDGAVLTIEDRAIAMAVRGTGSAPTGLAFDASDHQMLAWAVRAGRSDALPRLLALGLDPDMLDVEGETALHIAIDREDEAAIAALLAAGARTDVRDYDGATAAELLADRAAVGEVARTREAMSSAGDAAISSGDGGVRAREGARVRSVDRVDISSADFDRAVDAVVAGDEAVLASMLAITPALVHARSARPHRATLLHYCAANGVEDPRQRTPPNIAAIAERLLTAGADPDATCTLYRGAHTTMELMLTSSHPRAAGLDGALVDVLARHGAKLARRDLATAIMHGSPLAVAALVRAGVPVGDPFVAAGVGKIDLLATKDVDHRERDGTTALHAAAAMNQIEAARILLAAGADRSLRDHRWDATPADIAAHFGHVELASLLG
ncbi:MAG: ankyrin repeat domain-containing protein [Kofleriaceae bacterium]